MILPVLSHGKSKFALLRAIEYVWIRSGSPLAASPGFCYGYPTETFFSLVFPTMTSV